MPDRFWVGGTASWDGTAGTKWSETSGGPGGASVPTSADDVFFTNLSTGTCTIATGNTGAKSINCTGFTGTITGTAAIAVAGSVTLVAAMTYTHTGTMTFSGTGTLTTAGKTFSGVTVNGAGITLTIGDALNISTRTITLTQGTFTTSSFAITAGTITTTGGTFNMGNSTITVSSITIGTFTTVSAGNSSVVASSTVNLGGKTIYNLSVLGGFTGTSVTAGGGGTATVNDFTIRPQTNATFKRINVTGTFNVNGTFSAPAPTNTGFRSGIFGGSFVVASAGVVSCLDIRGVTFTGAATPIALSECGDLGSNSGLTFPAARTLYYRAATTWSSTTAPWATGPSVGATVFCPVAQDTCIIDDSSPSSLSMNASQNGYNIGEIDATSRTTAFTFTLGPAGSATTHYGNFQLSSSVTLTSTGSPTITFQLPSYRTGPLLLAIPTISGWTGTQNFNMDANCRLTAAVSGPAFTLGNDFSLDLNGFTLDMLSFTSSGTPTITWANGTIVARTGGVTIPTGAIFSGTGNVTLSGSTAKTFAGGNKSYATVTQNGLGALTITGSNTFTTLANSVQPTSFLFTAGTTTTLTNWNINGTAGNLVTIGSVTAASHTLSKASGTVTGDYLSISRSSATGDAAWNATNSIDGGNNSGWIFTAAPAAGGAFLMILL